MRRSFLVVAAVLLALPAVPVYSQRAAVDVSDGEALERALADTGEPVTIRLAPGEYHLTPEAAVDSTCGNCEDANTVVPVTVGARISGPSVYIEAVGVGRAVIFTHAGYGLLVEDCDDFRIKGVTVTGGVRDESPDATDAAIVVRRSKAWVQDCVIRDNIGDEALLAKNTVGIIGVCGREGADMQIFQNHIAGNSWDGIALYRGAKAQIYNNIIDGVDRAGAEEAGGGRGVGIGLTWDASARVERNLVRRYWKGIGVFVDADAQVVANIVEEMTAWGIAVWDAGKGTPSAAVSGNVIYDTGACGASIERATPLESGEALTLTGNAVVKTGQNPKYDDPGYYCQQCAVAIAAAPDGFTYRGNLFHNNRRASDELPNYDVDRTEFDRRCRTLITRIVISPETFTARQVMVESTFMREFMQ